MGLPWGRHRPVGGGLFRGVLRDLLPLPVTATPFELEVFLRGALLGFLLPLVATALPVWRGVRMAPIEAIRVGFRAAKGRPRARRARLRLPGGSLASMPARNALRAPRRTLMTALGIAAVVTVLFGLLGMVDSFLGTSDRSAVEAAGAHPDRLVAGLDGFRSLRSPTMRARAPRRPR